MQTGKDGTPPNAGKTSDWKNPFPGAVTFVETLDADDDPESADILSFESLRDAFATIQSAEKELVRSIPEIEPSAAKKPVRPEQPDYAIEYDTDPESENSLSSLNSTPPVVVGTCLKSIIEAMLFVGNRENLPLSADQIAEKLRNVSANEVVQAVDHLNAHYLERNYPYKVIFDCGGYRMVLRPEFEPVRSNFYGKVREARLSPQAIDTLAIVAYRQPITAEEIRNIRQQPCSAILNQLVRRNFLRISREMQNDKGIACYHTTSRFLELCRIQSLDDIPKTDEWDYR